jgi:hypothetical protein
MPGINDFLTEKTTSTTSLPSWYEDATKKAVNDAMSGANAMPDLADTTAGRAQKDLNDPNNTWSKNADWMSQIAAGGANPWMKDANGNMVGNPETAMGGLFNAQQNAFNQLLPTTIAPTEAGNIAGGGFGSLRGQTAVQGTKANALANMQQQQMQAALQNQANAINAGKAAGDISSQLSDRQTAMGQLEQMDPMKRSEALSKILAGIRTGETKTQEFQGSPLNQAMSLASLFGGASNGFLSSLGIEGGLAGLIKGLGGKGGGGLDDWQTEGSQWDTSGGGGSPWDDEWWMGGK